MLGPQDYLNARRWLEECRRPLLLTHRRPDGDALGALAGMAAALQALRINATPVLYEPMPERYALLADMAAWGRWDLEQAALTAGCDAVVILDTCCWQQLEPVAAWLPQAPRTLVMDHHATRDPIAARHGDLRLFDETAGAAALLVAEWVEAADVPLTPNIATALFLGIATDCGWFRFSNTDARLLRMTADLVAAGAQPAEIHRAIYEHDAPARLRLIARMLASLEMHAGGLLAVVRLRQADFAAAGADGTMTEDLINEATRLRGTEGTLLFTEEPDGVVRINLRSKRRLDVAVLAAQFGGGGHTRAAGARQKGEFEAVVRRVVQAAAAALASG